MSFINQMDITDKTVLETKLLFTPTIGVRELKCLSCQLIRSTEQHIILTIVITASVCVIFHRIPGDVYYQEVY